MVLEYTEWRNFIKVLNNAILSCKNSENIMSNHNGDSRKKVIAREYMIL